MSVMEDSSEMSETPVRAVPRRVGSLVVDDMFVGLVVEVWLRISTQHMLELKVSSSRIERKRKWNSECFGCDALLDGRESETNFPQAASQSPLSRRGSMDLEKIWQQIQPLFRLTPFLMWSADCRGRHKKYWRTNADEKNLLPKCRLVALKSHAGILSLACVSGGRYAGSPCETVQACLFGVISSFLSAKRMPVLNHGHIAFWGCDLLVYGEKSCRCCFCFLDQLLGSQDSYWIGKGVHRFTDGVFSTHSWFHTDGRFDPSHSFVHNATIGMKLIDTILSSLESRTLNQE